ncbi:MAG TPA: hypothetical protein VGC53_08780, partial [Vicinamibacteria bacterium]
SQITRRMTETWGDRSTVVRATQRVMRSFVLWGALLETEEKGVYTAVPKLSLPDEDGMGPWLVEASLSNCERRSHPLRSLLTSSAFFPFEVWVSPRGFVDSPRLEIVRHGLDEDLVMLR